MKSSHVASDEIKSATQPRVSGISSLQRFHPRQWIYSALADLVKKDLGIILGLFLERITGDESKTVNERFR